MLNQHEYAEYIPENAHAPNETNAHASNEKSMLLQELIQSVALQGYRFTTVTPLTHTRYLSRSDGVAKNIRDIFGWNLPFKADALPPLIFDLMSRADLLINCGHYFKSRVRISSVNDDLFLHSSFPTDELDAVFFGPDTYRFARFIKQSLKFFQLESSVLQLQRPLRILDVGCGSGAGGVAVIRSLSSQHTYQLYLNDINPAALEYASASTQAADIPATILYGDFFNIKNMEFDLIVSNPPYISDSAGRVYRDGGSHLGLDLSIRIVKHSLPLLAPGGRMLLYTGVAITANPNNPLLTELNPRLLGDEFQWSYEEIDPDIFGEELERVEYSDANRIAAVGLVVTRVK